MRGLIDFAGLTEETSAFGLFIVLCFDLGIMELLFDSYIIKILLLKKKITTGYYERA